MADAQNTNNESTDLRSILNNEKLNGSNFSNWYRNLRIVLRYEDKMKFIEQPLGEVHDPDVATEAQLNEYYIEVSKEQEVACLMLDQGKVKMFDTAKAFHACKQEDGQSVSAHFLKMKGYLDTLDRLGYLMPLELAVSFILNSLNKDFKSLVQTYNLHSMWKALVELHAMLKSHEKVLPKKFDTPAMMAIKAGRMQKDRKGSRTLEKELSYISGRVEQNGLRGRKKLKKGALSLYVGNGMRATIEAIGCFDLSLPNGQVIVLNNCHFTPTITRGVVSFSRLIDDGFINVIRNNVISVSKDNVFYFNAIPRDGIFEIDMHGLYSNDSSIFNVSRKRAKHALDSTYHWHCRLGHASKKRIKKL
ncbi:hypothetical protein Tco_1154598 [Tanacetum coccineum]